MKGQEQSEQARQALLRLSAAPSPDPLREASARRHFLEQAARVRGGTRPAVRTDTRRRLAWLRMGSTAFVALLALATLNGVARAADGALPGDLLYPLDRSMEELHLSLTHDRTGKVALLLDQADERLQETERLAGEGEQERMQAALTAYDQTIADLTSELACATNLEEQVRDPVVDQALSQHEQRLQTVRQTAPEAAWPGLDRAIEASQNGRGEDGSQDEPGKAPAAPGADPTGPYNQHPERTPGPHDQDPMDGHPGKERHPAKDHPHHP